MMNCPSCGAVMVWLNGSVLHDPPVKFYQCRRCGINATKWADGTVETDRPEQAAQQAGNV